MSPSFLDLPEQLKYKILDNLDVKTLVNVGMTCKLIYASHEFNLKIEMAKSELLPFSHIPPSAIARRMAQLQAHRTFRLTNPIETRYCDSITLGSTTGHLLERLFKGRLACLDGSTLRVWDLRHPDSTRPPPMVSMISEALLDAVIAPEEDLLILLCYHFGIIIKFFTLTSNGTQPHSRAKSHLIRLPEHTIIRSVRHCLTLHGPLLALVYCSRPGSRHGIVWDWKTGNCFYDSMNFDSTSNFHDILLLTSSSFLVTASTPSIDGPPTTFAAWIELHICEPSSSSRLVAEFCLPEFGKRFAEYDLKNLQFHSSEPQNLMASSINNEDVFPFATDTNTSVQVLHICYRPRADSNRSGGDTRVYLVISNRPFVEVLKKLARPNVPGNDTSPPLRIGWDEWGPPWTSMWKYGELKILSGMSSVCGSRICSVVHDELFVVDFNMNFPCTQRNCTDPSVHLSPKLFLSSESNPLWAQEVVHTWLPFHIQRKRIIFNPREHDDSDDSDDDDYNGDCTMVLMDEERIVLSTRTRASIPCWRIIHMLRNRQSTSKLLRCLELPYRGWQDMRQDKFCRLCRDEPHTDSHILLACTAHPEVVQLRQNLIDYIKHHHPALNSAWGNDPFHKLLDKIKVLRPGTQIRIVISSLVTGIRKIYDQLPSDGLVVMDRRKPPDKMFAMS